MRAAPQPEPSAVRCVANNINDNPSFACGGTWKAAPPMLKQADEMQQPDRPEIRQLIERAVADGRGWAEAEVAMARAELGELKGQAIRAVTFAVLGLAAVFCALVVLSQAGIAFLEPHVDSPGVAALIVGGVLLLLVAVCVLVMRSAFSWRTESIFFRWFGRRPSHGQNS